MEPRRDEAAADIGPADDAEQKSQYIGGAINRQHHLAHRLQSIAQRPLHQTGPSHAAPHGDIECAQSKDDDRAAPSADGGTTETDT